MPNPIADPLVENAVSPDLEGLVTIDASVVGAVVVTINRPETNNALNGEVCAALKEAFETLHAADHVRVVFLRGAGGNFSSGVDMEWLRTAAADWTEADLRDDAMTMAGMLHALTTIPALTVALVEGAATGGGAGLVAACDMAVSAADARYAFPEVRMGGVPAVVAPYVVNAIGPRQAKNLFMTGRTFDAAYAQQIGLVQQIVDSPPPEDSGGDASGAIGVVIQRLTAEALANGPEAMHQAKRMVWEVWGRPLDRGLMEETAKRFARVRFSEEGREGLAAVIEGRLPSWAIA
ncbi:MAG: enoyl-CoA hydratase/isomerase family protein [Caulobacteraceae bacterium]|nr:enoyl-CoA hydratase/isomerase family protein [Caulobacteraceae bacterium]